MRIYLSAYRLGARAEVLATDGGRAAIVMNALDPFPDRLRSWARETSDLARLGYSSTELDLRQFWGDPHALTGRLADVDLLWVVGGNAFVLARAATAAGLASALHRSPHLTYAGYSAGACLTSLDLAGIDLMDPADELPQGYRADMPATTLNLTGTRIVPHAGTPEADAAQRHLASAGLACTALADGEDLLVNF
ncbi:Type 1 glutamine amidotransferase-like domain-containing protein [Arsenicicoccus dermatophilus]|uniref:Type 1 glutamine amidotransferase-like domain-containing protein n=1 Tax=Arsenicicoccus dermatophilus TaxID=1076331 RepID=UPI003916E82A